MMSHSPRLLVLAAAAFGVLAADVNACVKRQASATPSVVVRQINATSWRVLVAGYETVATASGKFCGFGMSVPASGSITSVDSVRLVGDNASSMGITWAKNAAVGTAFNSVKSGSWTGFLGTTTSAIAAGKKCVYDVVVTTKSGTTLTTLTTDLKGSDVGSDAATSAGALAGGTLQSIVRITTVTESTLVRNSQMFHNVKYANISTRATADKADSLIFMQPRNWRRGQGDASGWQVRLQDQDGSTAETISVGFVDYSSATAITPDLSTSGALTKVAYNVFGTSSGSSAFVYTLTTSLGIPLPEYSGIRVDLPKPAQDFPADGLTIAMQDGDTTNLPAADRKQWTYSASGTTASALRPSGSTMHIGGLYDCGTVQTLAVSKAYGQVERLQGPEALRPNASGNEPTAFRIQNERFKTSVALIMVATNYGPALNSQYKKVLILVPFDNLIVPVDAAGVGQSIGFPVPKNISLAVQPAFFNLLNLDLEFGGAARFETR